MWRVTLPASLRAFGIVSLSALSANNIDSIGRHGMVTTPLIIGLCARLDRLVYRSIGHLYFWFGGYDPGCAVEPVVPLRPPTVPAGPERVPTQSRLTSRP
jgi:hypothetical protein